MNVRNVGKLLPEALIKHQRINIHQKPYVSETDYVFHTPIFLFL